MTTFEQLKAVALGQLGYIETPSNNTKYWAELDPGLQGQPWCAAYVSWVFKHAGVPLPAMDRAYGYMNVASARNYAQAHRLFSSSGHYAPGDIVLFGAGGTVHTGIILSDDGTTMVTIEGNTSPTEWGSQTNGGMVATRRRAHGPWVYGVLQSSKWLTAAPTRVAPAAVSRGFVRTALAAIKAIVTPKARRDIPLTLAVQRAVHVTADGKWGSGTQAASNAVIRRTLTNTRALQGWVGTRADGAWGPKSEAARIATVRKIQTAIRVTPDGDWGPKSQAAWSRAVAANLNKF